MIAKWSQLHLYTLKETPQEAEIASHKLMLRSGMIKKLSQGVYTFGFIGLKALRRFESIVREEHDKEGCQEILMPMVHPREIWEETGRWSTAGDLLLKFKNRTDAEYCLGATHEEAVTDYVRGDLKSYKALPQVLYQIQTKYRDEIRPRFGLMRCREFIMKDAYSFDATEEDALKSYEKMKSLYHRIFTKCGVDYRMVQADAGAIGGSVTHEFQLLASAGEDALMVAGDFAANREIAPCAEPDFQSTQSQEQKLVSSLQAFLATAQGPAAVVEGTPIEVSTPKCKTIADLAKLLQVDPSQLVKTLFLKTLDQKPVCVLLRGSDELNPIKLKTALKLGAEPEMLTDEEVKSLTGAWPGSCGPVGLKIPVYMDLQLKHSQVMVVGANRDGYHLLNVSPQRDFPVSKVFDLKFAEEGDLCPDPLAKGLQYAAFRGIEVGHIFYLGTKYSTAMNANFQTATEGQKPLQMGCYGIGVSRFVQAVIEQNHDANGIVWPKVLSPFHVHLCSLDPGDETVAGLCASLASDLSARGLDVFVDDRTERPGVKFKDADLLGFPVRVNIGKRGLDQGNVEIVTRSTANLEVVSGTSAKKFDHVVDRILEVLA